MDKNYGLLFINYLLNSKVLLLEKAWAKIFGSYEKIEGGLPREVLHALTGAPTMTF